SNQGQWEKYELMSDEFEGTALDPNKWYPKNPRWLGRQPAFFYPGNVRVSKGKLHLLMKKEEVPEMPRDKGYHTYTSAAVQSKTRAKYGYFEIKCRPMKSHGSSSFWFYDNTPDLWTEIDVFEIGGAAPGFEKKYNMNVHVFRTPAEKKHWSTHGEWTAPSNLADDYHVYGLEWDKEKVKWYFDGVLVRWVENTHWHQPLTLNFDSETMPEWFGLPKDSDLPSTYSIEYVRAWKKGSHNRKAN
ncbi:MAG: family 16 glycosylhydrolase, partial [Phycisphaerae bacterium]|nr:family 16 glycosylhydrolase [Phycisphaerae bacterium]